MQEEHGALTVVLAAGDLFSRGDVPEPPQIPRHDAVRRGGADDHRSFLPAAYFLC